MHPLPQYEELKKIYTFKNSQVHQVSNNPQLNFFKHLPIGKTLLLKLNDWIATTRYKRILRLKKEGSILDIGCSDGHFLNKFDTRSWQIAGVEINKNLAKIAQDRLKYASVYSSSIESFKTQKSFDVITLWHVLEHLKNPIPVLKKIYKLLRKNGLLVIEVPNGGSLHRKIFGPYWQLLLAPEHLYFWSKIPLINVLETAGFKTVRVSYSGIFPFSAASSIANYLRAKKWNSNLAIGLSIIFLPFIIIFNFFAFNWRENLLIIAQKTR